MSVGIGNGTTLTVTLVVNDAAVATVAPGREVYIPASQLSSLPWTVEARSPSGRVLASLVVHDGDVIDNIDPSTGNGSYISRGIRVFFSCGSLAIWSGGSGVGGPSEPAGSPGDCAP
jgi:hypothetical protein